MKYFLSPYLAWILLALALLSWLGVGYFLSALSSLESVSALQATGIGQDIGDQDATLRLHTLVRETKSEREALEEVANASLIEILDSVERAARDAGIPIEITQALSAPSSSSQSVVHSAVLVASAEGSFSEVVHILALLESLPTPSSVNEVNFEQISDVVWRVVVRIQFLTTADISS